MPVSIIVAAAENNVIGKNNDLIWHLPADLKFFKETTLGHHLIMGRKTYESVGKPLPGRINVIVTRQDDYTAAGCTVVHSIEEGIKLAKVNGDEEPFVAGGGNIYKQALDKNLVDKIYLTRIHSSFDGDAFFPELDSSKWELISEEYHPIDDRHEHDFTILTMVKRK